jgi:SAM-dependent methyltransferase
MPAAPQRIVRAIEALAVSPDHHVLEIGGGHGVSAGLICGILAGGPGRYLGLDRSATAMQRARERNAPHVSAGRAEFETGDVCAASLGPAAFDRILAINVNVFWTNPEGPAFGRLHAALKPDGILLLAFEGVSADAEPLRRRAVLLNEGLERNRFESIRTGWQTDGPRPQLHVVAERRGRTRVI